MSDLPKPRRLGYRGPPLAAMLFLGLLILGASLTFWIVKRADLGLRKNLLYQAHLLAQAINLERVRELTGTEADQNQPAYLRIKEQLATVRAATPHYRFIYLMGRKADDTIFIFVDSESEASKDYSPPGQIYHEVPSDYRRVFETKIESVVGPVVDRWGVWVSALIPLNDPLTGELIAVLGVDMDSRHWNGMLARAALPPLLLTLALMAILLLGSALAARRARAGAASAPRPRHLESDLAIVTGLVLALFAAWLAHVVESRNRSEAFKELAASTTAQVAFRMSNIRDTQLESLALFYESSGEVTAKEFEQFTTFLTQKHHAISAWEWIPVVPAADKLRFEEAARAEGLTGFAIWQMDPQGRKVPAEARALYYPVFRVEPLAGNERALGFDLGSEPLQHSAIHEATRTGLITATDPITLVQEAGRQKGMLIYRPVFAGDETNRLRGFALAVLRMDTLLRMGIPDSSVPMDLFLLHQNAEPELLATTGEPEHPSLPGLSVTRPILAYGKVLGLNAQATPEFIRMYPLRAGWQTLLVGLALTAALATALRLTHRRREQLEQMVAERTSDLRESERRFTVLARQSRTITWEVDAQGLFTFVSPVAEAVWGYRPDELTGRLHFYDLYPPAEREETKRSKLAVFAQKTSFTNWECTVQPNDGHTLAMSTSGVPLLNGDGSLRGYHGLSIDITERKQAEAVRHNNERRARRQRQAIARLAVDPALSGGDEQAALRIITEECTAALEIERASIWLFPDHTDSMQCVALFCATAQSFSAGKLLKKADYPRYFEAITTAHQVCANHAQTDPQTSEFARHYLIPLGITSMLDVGILWNGRLKWVVCFEHVGAPREWHPDETAFASTIAAMVAQASANAERIKAETALKSSEENFRTFFATVDDIIVVGDPAGNILYSNPAASARLGYSPDDFHRMNLLELHPHDRRKEAEAIVTAMFKGERNTCPLPLQSKSGVLIPVETRVWFGKWNGADCIFGICKDLTKEQEALQKFNRLFISNPAAMAVSSLSDHRFTDVNEAFLNTLGFSRAEVIGRTSEELGFFVQPEKRREALAGLQKHGRVINLELQVRGKDGSLHDGLFSGEIISSQGQKFFLSVMVDQTERKKVEAAHAKLQEQFVQAQKMESVGRLAGGVAHDFNNMLGVILGNSEMALRRLEPAQPLFAELSEIRSAALRSADLARQLLAYARKQPISPTALDLNDTVSNLLQMVQRLIGEDITLTWLPQAALWPVKADRSQIDQILANLCVNAKDAITGHGTLTIQTGNCTMDGSCCSICSEPVLGDYVMLAVSDSGCGMDAETIGHLFEPFFTTKEVGKGTGLGLATIFGIVKQNNGHLEVRSEPKKGTTFTVYLPRHGEAAAPSRAEEVIPASDRGRETVLLIEDEPALLNMAKRMLEHQGYTVLAASTPATAIRLAAEHASTIRLLMSDVIMPEMNGQQLAKILIKDHPHLKLLFISGYTADVIANHGVLECGVNFIQKPFSLHDLAAKVRSILGKT